MEGRKGREGKGREQRGKGRKGGRKEGEKGRGERAAGKGRRNRSYKHADIPSKVAIFSQSCTSPSTSLKFGWLTQVVNHLFTLT